MKASVLLLAADDTDGSKMILAVPDFESNPVLADQPEPNPPVRYTLRNADWPGFWTFMSYT